MNQGVNCWLVGFMAGVMTGMSLMAMWHKAAVSEPSEERIVVTDTIREVVTEVRDSVAVRYETHRLAVAKANFVEEDSLSIGKRLLIDSISGGAVDSVEVEIPIVQKEYVGEDYRAWVSGYMPSLDSIEVYRRTETIRVKEPKKRWHVGATCGVGLTERGLTPYIGIGITYSIISF